MSAKSILVTGCSAGGIGAVIALNLAKSSHSVFATARNTSKIPEELSSLSNVTLNVPWMSAYTSSKAALTNLSECLRLELSPFGVAVVTIMAGIITSHFHDNDADAQLPEGSLYAPIQDIIDGWTSGRSKPKGISADQFAAHVAPDILGDGKGGLVWKGPNAGSIKLAIKWFPQSLVDAAMSKDQGLDKLVEKSPR
ncbi:oxidoreductase [Daldinia decipiens]|uniref:oxidoreductase n=1 Tax=Daldinia decipiens TaxID=326647 RepID=UPI0020C1E173|nr:oxidoreductase [Daldinia decipiens]KAI1657539.1 oxidoreductase [Daldinia decipiens]